MGIKKIINEITFKIINRQVQWYFTYENIQNVRYVFCPFYTYGYLKYAYPQIFPNVIKTSQGLVNQM